MKRMRPDIKADWVRALRSGQYEQTKKGALIYQTDDQEYGYCCLGVLCEIQGMMPSDGDMNVSQIEELEVHFDLEMGWQERLAVINDFANGDLLFESMINRQRHPDDGEDNYPPFVGTPNFANIATYIEEHL